MKISDSLNIREIAGKKIVYGAKDVRGQQQVICLSGSTAWLLEQLKEEEFTLDEAVEMVCAHYDVGQETARKDVSGVLSILEANGLMI